MDGARVLIVEDEALISEELGERLTRLGFAVDGPIRSSFEAIDRATASPPDLVLMDIRLAGRGDGIDAATAIGERCEVPIVFLTAFADDATLARATSTAPFGYLLKPVSDAHLKATIAVAMERYRVEREAKAAAGRREAWLQEQADIDLLTGLRNRRGMLKFLDTEVSRAVREHTSIAAIMIDADHFKQINDSFGHAAGDAVLREIASRMVQVIRRYGAVGRFGGEEFLFVSHVTDQQQTDRIAERLRGVVAAEPVGVGSHSIPVSISLGAHTATPASEADALTIVAAADSALYTAKRAGRNRVSVSVEPGKPAAASTTSPDGA